MDKKRNRGRIKGKWGRREESQRKQEMYNKHKHLTVIRQKEQLHEQKMETGTHQEHEKVRKETVLRIRMFLSLLDPDPSIVKQK
jgi:hypothetical protein